MDRLGNRYRKETYSMNRRAKTISFSALLLVFWMALPPTAEATPTATAIYEETFDLGTGLFTYDYTLTNTSLPADGTFIFDFFLDVAPFPGAVLSGINGPAGWNDLGNIFSDNATFIDWNASLGSEIAPGVSLDGFLFSSDLAIGDRPFTVLFADGSGTPLGSSFDGTSAIPEPGSLLLLVSGLAGLGRMFRRRMRKA